MIVDTPREPSLCASPPLPYHEAVKCPLFFDPRGPSAPPHASAKAAREKLALTYARAGFYRVEHILGPDGRSFLTQRQFTAAQPLRPGLAGYTRLLETLPAPVISGLKEGSSPAQLKWVSYDSPSGTQVARAVKPAGPDHIMCHPHRVCARTANLTPRSGRLARIPAQEATPAVVREAIPPLEKGTSGPPPRPARLLSLDICTANIPKEHIGLKWPLTLERRPPTMLASLTVNNARCIRNASLWRPPRTLSEGGFLVAEDGIYCRALTPTGSTVARNKEIRKIFRLARHELLPEKLSELAYRVIMSGFWLGSAKMNRRRGDSDQCHHCQEVETVEHVFFSCPKARSVWAGLLRWWEKRTQEPLECSARVVLLGLRYSPDDDQDRLQFEELGVPFLFLRTHTYDVLNRERHRVRQGSPARATNALISAVLQDMQHSARALFKSARKWDLWHPPSKKEVHPRSKAAFCATWVESGLAILTPSDTYPAVVLRIRHQ